MSRKKERQKQKWHIFCTGHEHLKKYMPSAQCASIDNCAGKVYMRTHNVQLGSPPVMRHVVKNFHHDDHTWLQVWHMPCKGLGSILLHHRELTGMLVAMQHLLLLHGCQVRTDFQSGVACARIHIWVICLKMVLQHYIKMLTFSFSSVLCGLQDTKS